MYELTAILTTILRGFGSIFGMRLYDVDLLELAEQSGAEARHGGEDFLFQTNETFEEKYHILTIYHNPSTASWENLIYFE